MPENASFQPNTSCSDDVQRLRKSLAQLHGLELEFEPSSSNGLELFELRDQLECQLAHAHASARREWALSNAGAIPTGVQGFIGAMPFKVVREIFRAIKSGKTDRLFSKINYKLRSLLSREK